MGPEMIELSDAYWAAKDRARAADIASSGRITITFDLKFDWRAAFRGGGCE